MGKTSDIQWTTSSWNPWRGCDKVSPGCDHCYMFRDQRRYGRDPEVVVRASGGTFGAPLAWDRQQRERVLGSGVAEPWRVFTCSWSDFFHPEADGWRDDAWAIIRQTPYLTYQILTKRPNRIRQCLPAGWGDGGYPNVWLGVTVESAPYLWRTGYLAAVPAAVRFCSYEPAIGPLLRTQADAKWLAPLDWLIVGGESGGHEARRPDPEWFTQAIDAGRHAGAAIFVKQLGSALAREGRLRHPHGGDWNEWPDSLRIREWPTPRLPAQTAAAGLLRLAADALALETATEAARA